MNKFDPYKSKIAVSTGAKKTGRSHFFAGSIKDITNEWKNRGLNIVPKNQAEYVIVPDGTKNIGNISATPIFYSDFVSLLDQYPSRSLRTLTTDPIPKHDKLKISTRDSELENNLEFVKEELGKQKQVVVIDLKKIESEPIPSAKHGKPLQSKQFQYSLDFQSYLALLKYFVQEKIQNFVTDILSKKFYYQLYEEKSKILKKNIDSLHQLLRVWSELRINLEISLGDIPARININDEKPCELDTEKLDYLQSTTPLSECWIHFRKNFNETTQQILSDSEALNNIAQERYPELIQYFWMIESDLILMYLCLLCAKYQLKSSYLQWAKNVREDYAEFQEKKCAAENKLMCLMQDGKYLEKPIIFVLEELVTAFCVVDNHSPEKKKLEQNLRHLYESWFHKGPEQGESCEQIRDMYGTIIATLKHELGLRDLELIVWSEIPGLLNINQVQWNDLFSKDPEKRKPVLQYLAKTIKSSDYRQKVVDILGAL